MSVTVKDTAQVADSASLGDGTTVWELAQVREDATLGAECVVGRGAYVGSGVRTNSRPGHNGVDIAQPKGVLIRAASAGRSDCNNSRARFSLAAAICSGSSSMALR